MKPENPWPVRQVLLDLYEVREAVSPGRYGPEHLRVLSRSLRWTQRTFSLSQAKLARDLLFTPKLISSVLAGCSPKLDNFLRLTNNLISYLEDWIARNPGVPPVLIGVPAEWRALKSTAVKKIARIAADITELLDIIRRSNSLAANDVVMPPELRAQLIALLETALAQLKSPLMEKSFLAKIGRWLPRLGKKLGEEAGEKVVERLATKAGDRIIDLIEGSLL